MVKHDLGNHGQKAWFHYGYSTLTMVQFEHATMVDVSQECMLEIALPRMILHDWNKLMNTLVV